MSRSSSTTMDTNNNNVCVSACVCVLCVCVRFCISVASAISENRCQNFTILEAMAQSSSELSSDPIRSSFDCQILHLETKLPVEADSAGVTTRIGVLHTESTVTKSNMLWAASSVWLTENSTRCDETETSDLWEVQHCISSGIIKPTNLRCIPKGRFV